MSIKHAPSSKWSAVINNTGIDVDWDVLGARLLEVERTPDGWLRISQATVEMFIPPVVVGQFVDAVVRVVGTQEARDGEW